MKLDRVRNIRTRYCSFPKGYYQVRKRRGSNSVNIVQIYLTEINRIPRLTPEQEKEIAKQVQEGDPDARKKMIKANLRLVVSVAKDFSRSGISFLDLIEEGNLGLIKAVDKYEYKLGYRFSTYATWWIKQSMLRLINNQSSNVRIPVYIQELKSQIIKTERKLIHKLKRPPTDEEVAKELGYPVDKIIEVKRYMIPQVSLNTTIDDLDEIEFGDLLMDPANISKKDFDKLFFKTQLVHDLLDKLNEKERKIIELRYGISEDRTRLTLKEIGEIMGITRERVRQIEHSAIKKLKNIISREGWKG